MFTTQPTSTVTGGSNLPVGGVIEVEDNNGNLITSGSLSTVSIELSDASGNGNLSGVNTVTAVGGIATIPNNTLLFEKAGTTHLAATANVSGFGTLSGTSSAITVSAPSFSTVSAFSGPDNPNGDVNGNGTSARLWYPTGLVSDGTYIYIAEPWPACVIRRYEIASPNTVTTWAGQLYNCGNQDGASGSNTLNFGPGMVQMATDGTDIYFVTYNAIRAANISTGAVTTIAGTPGTSGYVNNTTGTSALFRSPRALYVNSGTLYVGDTGNCVIRAVSLTSPFAVTTYAGDGTCGEVDNSNPTSAELNTVNYFAADSNYLYFVDNGYIRESAWASGAITTLFNNTYFGGFGATSIAVNGTSFYVYFPFAIQTATVGTWAWSTVAGNGVGDTDGGVGTSTLGGNWEDNYTVTLYPVGTNLYFADAGNGGLRMLDNTDTVTTLAGTPNAGENQVDNTTAVNSRYPALVDPISDGIDLFTADWADNGFDVTSLADGSTGSVVPAPSSTNGNQQLAIIGKTLYYVGSCEVYTVDPYNSTSAPLAGNGTCAEKEGSFSTAEFTGISAIATDQKNLYVFDNDVIKKLDLSTDTVSILSGTAGTAGCATGAAASSLYNGSAGGMAYLNGKLYFTDWNCGGDVIAVDTSTGTSIDYAGSGTNGYVDGPLSSAEFYGGPMTTDGVNLYMNDELNWAIRKIDAATGTVSTLFGSPSRRYEVDGALGSAGEADPIPGYMNTNQGYHGIYFGYGKLYITHFRGIRVVQ